MRELVDTVFRNVQLGKGPGCALGIVQDGELVYGRGYGFADVEKQIPIDTMTSFDIASEAKQFTGASILILQQEGDISLDSDIREYFPQAKKYNTPIKVRHLVHHTSGLPDYEPHFVESGLVHRIWSDADMVEMIFEPSQLNFQPGDRYEYCNSGYVLLAQIVERVTGRSFGSFVSGRIFAPLHMGNSFLYNHRGMAIPRKAIGYSLDGTNEFVPGHYDNWTIPGDGKMYSCIEDLYLWDKNFYSSKIGPNGFTALMTSGGTLNNGSNCGYGFGLDFGAEAKPYKNLYTVTHAGRTGGFCSIVLRFPEKRFTVMVLSNFQQFDRIGAALEIAEVFLFNNRNPRSIQ